MKGLKIKGWRLWGWLSLIFTSTLLVTVFTVYGFTLLENRQQFETRESQLLLSVGRQLAQEPRVISALKANKADPATRAYANSVAKNFKLDFVVIMNMQAIRLTHPDPKQINRHFRGGDEVRALQGHAYVSVQRGTLGRSLRGFVPVYQNRKQIGVVALGIKVTALQMLIHNSQNGFRLALLVGIVMGILIAFLVAYYIKRQLHDLEPKEIARLLEERNAMLEETKDPVIVVDLNQTIVLVNRAASKLQRHLIHEQAFIGRPLTTLIAHPERIKLTVKTEQFYQQDGQDYLFSAAPIIVKKQKIGYVIFLRNATEAIFVADQLANTTAYANALQSQSHEFMNKLHVIYGLVAIKQYDELAIYLQDLLKPEQEFANRLALLVKNFVADQLANTTAYANALQSQSHEFMNKLHVIYGLVAIKQYDELAIYLQDLLKPEQEFANRLALLVKNPLVAGFMIGEREKFAERKTTLNFEIVPELPANPNVSETKSLLTVSRYLHFGLLQQDLPATILIQLDYAQNQLTITYHLAQPLSRNTLLSVIHQDYFQQLLSDLHGTATLSPTDPLVLTLVVDYHEEAKK